MYSGGEKKELEGGRRGYLWAISESELKVSKTSEKEKRGEGLEKKGIETILERKEEGMEKGKFLSAISPK